MENLIKKIKNLLPFYKSGKQNYKDVIEDLIDQQDISNESIDDGTKKIFSNVIDIHNKCVEDVMVPRADIIAISENSSMQDLLKLISDYKHSRIPVYSNNLDKIIGMIHIRDIFSSMKTKVKLNNQKKIKEITRDILFTAPSMKILDLLLKMRSEKIHMSIVVDEYGGTYGLATIEDLVEEIVGEIEDEHDMVQGEYFKKLSKSSFELSARMLIEDFEDKIGKDLQLDEKEKIDTVGGLVFSLAERVPERGEVITHPNGIEFNVLEADRRRVKKIIAQIKEK
tara:strand:- start:9 stop:854 length:846 start_codon:yes stop_codon:yes gene_type:complete